MNSTAVCTRVYQGPPGEGVHFREIVPEKNIFSYTRVREFKGVMERDYF
jgi:hypothetical protein